MMSLLHPQCQQRSVAYHALVHVRLLAHGVAPFRPAAMRSFRSRAVATSRGAIYSSPRAMAIKQKLGKPVVPSTDALRTLLSSAITSYGLLHEVLTENRLDVSFSNVQYKDIAPFVRLQPGLKMKDIKTFGLHRSRIPTMLFRSIVEDIDVMMVQYGPLDEHSTGEATSRFLSPIFNRLIAVFGFAFRNLITESTIESRITTKGNVEHYFRAIGSIAVVFVETKIGSGEGRLDAIAQLIAECNACDWDNARQGLRVPVYGILSDGSEFEFFLFSGTTKAFSIKCGLGPNDPPTCPRPLELPDPAMTLSTRLFIDALRPICEIIFDLLLSGYISSLKVHHDHSVNKSIREGRPRNSVDKWEEAISAAIKASQGFRDAETKRQTQLVDEANSIVEEAMTSLKCSVDAIEAIPILYKPELIMSGWDDEGIEKV